MASVSLVICTYERPDLLGASLASVSRLRRVEGVRLDIVVVDNSDTGSARAVVEAASARSQFPIAYVVAHPPNIAVARNVGVATAKGEVLAFLDDDQEVADGWLEAVAAGLDRFAHDVFFGPIVPRFENDNVASAAARQIFTRAYDAPAGTDLQVFGPKPQPFVLSTANSIFRRSRTLNRPEPFDRRLGQCGGEDFLLFCALQRDGRSFGWLPGAGATDFIPAHRCGFRYLMARHYSGGQAFAAGLIWTSPRPTADRMLLAAKALLQICGSPLWMVKALLRKSRREAVPAMAMKIVGSAGQLAFGRPYPLYRKEAERSSSRVSAVA